MPDDLDAGPAPRRSRAIFQGSFGGPEKAGLFVLAAAAIIAGLYFFRSALTQFALAGFLWLGANGFAGWLQSRLKIGRIAAMAVGGLVVIGLAALIGVLLAQNISHMAAAFPTYRDRLDELIKSGHHAIGLPPPAPTVDQLLDRVDLGSWVAQTAGTVQGFVADAVFILIYLGFIFGSASAMPRKLDRIFPEPKRRARAKRVIDRIIYSMEVYLWTQTVISLIISGLTFVTLWALGLENALFWSLFIFFLNYIPTVGSLLATVLPTLVALVQFDAGELWRVAAVAGGTAFWQFFIGNFLQPRFTSGALNLSALVVLLALALWGSVWGITGAFLSAPLTVAMMIVLAQFPSTRWVAILLSADGRPERASDRAAKP